MTASLVLGQKGTYWFEDFEKEIHAEETPRRAFLIDSGVEDCEVQRVDEYYRRATPLARNVKPDRLLKEGDIFDLSTMSFTVTNVPGHTPWCVLLHDVENRISFSGDFLQTVTSNPLIQRNTKTVPSYNSLRSYIRSLKTVYAMRLKLALPGHGEIIWDGSEKAKEILVIIDQRREAILHFLKGAPQTAAEMSHKLFPDLLPGQLFNAISEVTAHVEILEEEGLIQRTGHYPIQYFCDRC